MRELGWEYWDGGAVLGPQSEVSTGMKENQDGGRYWHASTPGAGTLGCGLEWKCWDWSTEMGVLGWGENQGEGAPRWEKVSWNALGCRNTGMGGSQGTRMWSIRMGEAAGLQENVDGQH